MLILGIFAILVSIATFVIFIMVLIKLFNKEGALKGILGLICALYTFIWGWQNHQEEGITQLMQIWTGLILVSIVLNVISQAATG